MQRVVVITDEDDKVKGEMIHSEAHARGLPHRAAAVYVTNESGKILVQVRAYGDPLDHSAAEHLTLAESYEDGARRALREELGIEANELHEVGVCISNENIGEYVNVRHYFKVFECRAEPGGLNPERVLSVFWADPRRVWNDMRQATDHDKYCGGFRETLKLYLVKKGFHKP